MRSNGSPEGMTEFFQDEKDFLHRSIFLRSYRAIHQIACYPKKRLKPLILVFYWVLSPGFFGREPSL
ncbi:MAG: hypothetical protein CMO40_08235 [Verrucomicrobiaceae bacterium]|nr:hypothetical protein [Verrucomicrobiaceae bacterium]